MPPGAIILIIAVIAAVIAYAIYASKKNAERIAALRQFARDNNLQFRSSATDIDSRYNGIGDIGKGHDRYAEDVLELALPPGCVFRYHYRTWETRMVTRNNQTTTETYEETHWRQYLIVEVGGQFPSLSIRPEGLFDKLAGMVGVHDINFESNEFSRAYHVASADKAFAYALLHPQMIEFLLPYKTKLELHGPLIVIDMGGVTFDAEHVCRALNESAGVVNRIPPFVWQDYGKTPAVTLPNFAVSNPLASPRA